MNTSPTLLQDERIDYVNEKITLIQKKNGLTFGTDAFLLASYIKPSSRARAAELGCGTGIISLLCASRQKLARIYAFEVQEKFFELTKRNIENNDLGSVIEAKLADIRNICSTDTDGELDIVFSNPPYMRTDSGKRNEYDEKYIARHEVMGGINDFCASASKLLKHSGKFYVVWRPDRISELMQGLFNNNLEPKQITFVHADADSEPSMMLLCATKGGKPYAKVTPPLILHDIGYKEGNRRLSEKAQKIYDTLNFDI